MKIYVGIDIGAISATAALLAEDEIRAAVGSTAFSPMRPRAAGQRLYLSRYRRTRGKPVAAATALLEEVVSLVGGDGVAGICLTGGASRLIAAKLGATVVNEFKAIAAGFSAVGSEVRCVFEMGGETSKYLLLARNDDGTYGIRDYATNGDCAAGTGAFMDQQAGRLKFDVEDIGRIVLETDRAAQIAGRCSVFAKSDMIHAQPKGYTPAEVLRGLANAVATSRWTRRN
ncbi:MAG: BadF/BadG/BcrA/BcrD ATPase family protein [Planctomycetota bacterium]|jgi:activator of 2-hydroxyglutaryl-CoA dehydratase